MEKLKNIPSLRFPEFYGEWETKLLGEVTSLLKDGTHGTHNDCPNGKHFLLSAKNIRNGVINFDESDRKISEKEFVEIYKNYFLKENDILLTIVGTIGRVAKFRSESKIAFQRSVAFFRFEEDLPDFILHIMNSVLFQKELDNRKVISAQPGIYLGDLAKIPLKLPTLPEQQKIASFLSAVDEKIQQLSRKKELLTQYKKGVMQQLFSGTLRFKDENGKDYSDWVEKTFGEIYSFYTTNSLSREKLNYKSGVVKNIHYGDIHTKFKTLFNINNESVPFINSDFDVSKIKNECYCREGDIVIADASEDYADIGKSIEIVNLQNIKVVAGLHTLLARPNKTKMFIGFSGYILRSINFRKQIMTIAQGSKVLSISTGRLAMIKMKIPCVQEQQKIAEFLSSVDTKIESTKQQINQTQSFKKGLLQQMFC